MSIKHPKKPTPYDNVDIAAELKAWRRRKGHTQTEAAAILAVPLGTYRTWEQGRQVPDQKGPILKLMKGETTA